MTSSPKPKTRTIRKNVYGNWVGYVGGRRTEDFGDHANSEGYATEWMTTGTNLTRASYNS